MTIRGNNMPPPTGIDETLKLEVVYLSAPIPRNLAVLTVLGAIFEKVYFQGVYLPRDGCSHRHRIVLNL
jgi:hypothetical protein